MPRDESRTIKVRCSTWEQVEAFTAEKLRGDSLVVKMPVQLAIGEGVTVALGLPNGLVFAIDGAVVKVGGRDAAGKYPVALKMHGLTKDVRARLDRLVSDGKAGLLSQTGQVPVASEPPPPAPETSSSPPTPGPADAPVDELVETPPEPRLEDCAPEDQEVFRQLAEARERHDWLATHELLGVPPDADARTIRAAYFALAKKFHPDVYGKHRSAALRILAQEIFIQVNKAYDRLREAALRAGGAVLPGPARHAGGGWLAVFDDVAPAAEPEPPPPILLEADPAAPATVPAPPASMGAAAAGGVPEEEPDETPFDSARIAGPLTAEALFGDMQLGADGSGTRTLPPPAPVTLDEADKGRAALEAGRWDEARALFAAALRADPRNREVRALYHVASGLELRARGQAAEAVLQFETALVHDRECLPALDALGRGAKRGRLSR